jgi:hypothetical protein
MKPSKKRIKFKIIRLVKELVIKIDKFKKGDIERMIALGKDATERAEWNS